MLVLLTVTAAVILVFWYIVKKDSRIFNIVEQYGHMPGDVPILGHAWKLFVPHDKLLPTLEKMIESCGTTVTLWLGNYPYFAMFDPRDVEKVLSSTVHINKGSDYQFLEAWLGTGLLTASREKWQHRRKLLTPAFHFKILEDFVPIFNAQAKILTQVLKTQLLESDSLDISPFLSRCTLDVICETAMGEKINAQTGGGEDYVKTVCGISEMVMTKGLVPIYRNTLIWNIFGKGRLERKYLAKLHGFTERVIKNRKADRLRNMQNHNSEKHINPEGVKQRKAFLDLLLELQETGNFLNDADIREEVDTFMFEGHDTTAASLVWTVFTMARHPECQELVHQELDRVLGSDPTRDITSSDVAELKYLSCCIKETLRLYPSVPFVLRRLDQDLILDEHRTVPKGVTLGVVPYFTHRLASVFPNPEVFDPQRFSPENSVGRHPYAFIPFAAGPRNCIGQRFAMLEEKIILATLFRAFRVEAVSNMESVLPVPDVILRPNQGLRVRLVKRN